MKIYKFVVFPSFLVNLRCLTTLNLNNNFLTKIPRDICNLINLEKLSMDNNFLRYLPIEICALTKLKELRISKNKLERLPLELGFLSKLEELHVPLNRLRELPEVTIVTVPLKTKQSALYTLYFTPADFIKVHLGEYMRTHKCF